jgi:hypothetical protein
MGPEVVVMFEPLPNDNLDFSKTVEDLPIRKVIPKVPLKLS